MGAILVSKKFETEIIKCLKVLSAKEYPHDQAIKIIRTAFDLAILGIDTREGNEPKELTAETPRPPIQSAPTPAQQP